MKRLLLTSYLEALLEFALVPLRLRTGDPVHQLEWGLARRSGLPYALALNSGTSANEAAIAALDLEPGDEVICPATAPAFVSIPVLAAGCVPVFADVDARTLIPRAQDVAERLTPRSRAVVVVHLFGQPAPMAEITELTEQHDLSLVEDCAQAHDSYFEDRRVGTFGVVMTSSLHASKAMTTGEGGFLATRDEEIYKRAVLYSNAGLASYAHGVERPKPDAHAGLATRGHLRFGHNHRMSVFQAIVGRAQLRRVDRFHAVRDENTGQVIEHMSDCPGIDLAHVYSGTRPRYWEYPLRLRPEVPVDAGAVVEEVRRRFPPAYLHAHDEINYLEPVFREMEATRTTPFGLPLPEHVRYRAGTCPEAERAVRRLLRCSVHHLGSRAVLRRTLRTLREVLTEQLG
jgi:dTDP-4-amino-4,6-dideoxygalactose transaminase